jgi:putative glutamine amidotransferase
MPTAGARPLIGVTAYRQVTSWGAWERDAALVPGLYVDMVWEAGGQPVLIPPVGGDDDQVVAAAAALVGTLGGLVLVGGGDIDATRYGQDPDPRAGGTSLERDRVEVALLSAALVRDLPVLAVCRGHQLLNVVCGGDLVQYLPDVVGSTDHQPRAGAFAPMSVTTEPGSKVARILGDQFEVLCCHHQAIGSVGQGLVVTATSHDGVIEAVELPGHRFAVGVQWHPEERRDLRLFEALIESVKTRELA